MTPHRLNELLVRADAGVRVDELAAEFDMSDSAIYDILRQYRPDRARSPRTLTSDMPDRIRAMRSRLPEASKARIATLLGTSRQYVHRVLGKEGR